MTIEVLKQALEALSDFDYDKRMAAITALRQAIAEAEKREWVGLTPEEKEECRFQSLNGTGWSMDVDTDQFARAIEAKLKEKNFT